MHKAAHLLRLPTLSLLKMKASKIFLSLLPSVIAMVISAWPHVVSHSFAVQRYGASMKNYLGLTNLFLIMKNKMSVTNNSIFS